jgi:hypothetical protein
MRLTQNGMVIKQTATQELLSISGDTGKIAMKLKQTADRQKISQNGANVDVLSLNSTGTGEMSFDLAKLVPSLATVSLTSDSKMNVEAMGQKNDMSMKLEMTMGMQAK